MDYGELLYKAQQNERDSAKQDVRCYKSGFSPPKKLQRTVSSANIKKFLTRKENEEKQKLTDAQKKKEELLALRSQDKKAKRRVEFMLKRTKSANYSVMEDAIDNNNTADTLSGPMQCDEDDYGYVSQEASAFYAKLMNKYNTMPTEPSPFSKTKREVKDLSAAKDRVRAALRKEEEDAELPHKRKRKHKEEESEDPKEDQCSENVENKSKISKSSEKPAEPAKKKHNNAPPPPSFSQLLKLAEEKKSKPVDIDKIIKSFATKEPDRPMTQKEKIEWQQEQERKRNRERRERGLPPLPSQYDDKPRTEKITKFKVPKLEGAPVKQPDVKDRVTEPLKKTNADSNKRNDQPKPSLSNKAKPGTSSLKSGDRHKHTDTEKKVHYAGDVEHHNESLGDIERQIELLKRKKLLLEKNKLQAEVLALSTNKHNDKSKASHISLKSVPSKPMDNKVRTPDPPKQKSSLTAPLKQKQITGATKEPQRVPGSSQNMRPSYLPPTKPKEKIIKKQPRRIDSESEEYDSELDDFIEDEGEEKEDYSNYIKEIFGYDKSRYKNIEDDECMESNFAQQMKEEFVSTKFGIMEDLEDIRKEQEEKKRLKAKKMMKGKAMRGK